MEILRPGAYREVEEKKSLGELSSDHVFQRTMDRGTELNRAGFSETNLKNAVTQANEISVMFDRGLKFEYKKEADIYQVSVIDTSKDEVVRKIPPDEVVRFIERIKDMFGAMLDVQA